MSLDRSIEEIHLKVKGCQVCFICCKFTKVSVLRQTVSRSVALESGSTLFLNVPQVPLEF